MALKKTYFLLLFCYLAMVGCASQPSMPHQQTAPPASLLPLPENLNSTQLRFYLLAAEFALQKDDLATSLEIYHQLNQQFTSLELAQRTYWLAQFGKQPSIALAAANKWVELSPQSLDANKNLAFMLLETKDFAQALDQLLKINALNGKANFTAYASFLAASDTHELATAYKKIQQQLAQEEDATTQTDMLIALAILATYQNNKPLAKEHLTQAEELNSPYLKDYLSRLISIQAQHLYQEAMQAYAKNNLEQMEAKLHQILTFTPKNPTALNALGYVLVDKTSRLEEGYNYIKQAHELRPDSPEIQDSLGWALYKLNQPEEGLAYLQQAYSQLKDDEVAQHLYEVLMHLNKTQAAEELLTEHPEIEALSE